MPIPKQTVENLYKSFTFCSKSVFMRNCLLLILISFLFFSCTQKAADKSGGNIPVAEYFNYGDTGVQSAGIRLISIKTPVGNFKVWTKRFGNNPA
jgi:proline iminopeptidase